MTLVMSVYLLNGSAPGQKVARGPLNDRVVWRHNHFSVTVQIYIRAQGDCFNVWQRWQQRNETSDLAACFSLMSRCVVETPVDLTDPDITAVHRETYFLWGQRVFVFDGELDMIESVSLNEFSVIKCFVSAPQNLHMSRKIS